MASCAKGYQALPLLTFHRCYVGRDPGNEVCNCALSFECAKIVSRVLSIAATTSNFPPTNITIDQLIRLESVH